MDDEQLREIEEKYAPKVKLWCDEDALVILRLVHVVRRDRQLVRELHEEMGKKW